MKSILITIITLSIFSTIPSYGQEKSKEDSNTKEESWYSRFTRRKIEEKTLFKLGYKGLSSYQIFGNRMYSIRTETAIEYKFTSHLSFNLKVKYFFGKKPQSGIIWTGSSPSDFPVESFHYAFLSPEIRYYFGLNKGIKKGNKANNFNGMFIAVQFDEMINIGKDNLKKPKISLLFGVQQRLGKFGYIDLMIGPSYDIYDYKTILLRAEFAIGFAF